MRQFRAELRFPSTVAADVSWDIGAGYLRKIAATTADVPRSGACVVTAVGSKLEVKFEFKFGRQIRSNSSFKFVTNS